jgi:Holliday junction DNA helicase RuvB
VRGTGTVTADAANSALELLEVDELGCDRLDREILTVLCTTYSGRPVGLSTLSIAVGEESDTIEEVYEPYLVQCGLISRTARGRTATMMAYEHLGLEPPRDAALF